MLAVEVYYYGVGEPIRIPLPGSDPAVAESYFQQVKFDVIEAQRHSHRTMWIAPFQPSQEAQAVEPSSIRRVVLVDCPEPDDFEEGMSTG
ncbi:MAG: hypothetical protein H0X18_14390 [Geodermatophilaceae bacterium]|nr:hypothetical protein [Geodermatophilaceae bacterium]